MLELLKDGTLIQGTIAIGCVGAIIYLAVTGQPVPEVLVSVASAIVGYFFGTGQVQRIARMARGG